MSKNTILRLVELVNGAAARTTAEHVSFLDFLETLVVAAGPEVSKAFGNMSVKLLSANGAKHSAGIELTPADYLYWRTAILERGERFEEGVARVKMEIFNRMSSLSETHQMTPAERAEFVALVKASPALKTGSGT